MDEWVEGKGGFSALISRGNFDPVVHLRLQVQLLWNLVR